MKDIVYAHEHITIDFSGAKHDGDCRMDNAESALSYLRALNENGVTAVVDQTARGMGRNPLYTQGLSEIANVRVLHATGFYKEPFLPPECYLLDEKAMRALFLRELLEGIEDTGIRASHIGEIGTGKGEISQLEAQIFRAAAQAHNESGAPICTHTTLGTLGDAQVALFKDMSVDLSHVVLSHIDLAEDFEYVLRILDTGVNIGFDTVGKNNYQPDERRADWLLKLCQRGYCGQIVLSMDVTRTSNAISPGYLYLIHDFLPRLRALGLNEAWIRAMISANARRIYRIEEATP